MAELVPIPFSKLLKRIYYEYQKNNSIFDLPSKKFYYPDPELDLSVSFSGNKAANSVGPAAGPHTQLAQNIVLSWLAGSRMLELKTVQIKDDLRLSRPCIDMATVGFNTEWSQELKLDESLREYVKAWMIIEILKHAMHGSGFHFDTLNPTPLPYLETVFDVSVGYDLAGIQSTPIRNWLSTMRIASTLIEEYRKQIPEEFFAYRDIHFNQEISNSITLSTFHGCPANEIEKICEFLLTEMGYHVIVKMNPPMLGKQRLEHLLYEKLGYTDIEVNPKAYETAISFNDAAEMIRRLERVASRCNKTVGVKFGNTLEVINKGTFLKDNVQYLSGQPLHILHLALVDEWRKVFGAEFPISFSAGVDANNFADMATIGLVPITTCTDLLRPGGYGRLPQYLYNLERRMKKLGVTTINEYIVKSFTSQNQSAINDLKSETLNEAILWNTSELLQKTIENPRYHYCQNKKAPRKIGSHLHLFDCINCDKCIPVCPNDANFYFEVEPFEIHYKNIEIDNDTWREVDGGLFALKEKHQIGNFADACNECGNCDIFCPEDGGPYIEKPRFFGSLDAWKNWKLLSGFYYQNDGDTVTLFGRFHDKEFEIDFEKENHIHFRFETIVVTLEPSTDRVVDVLTDNTGSHFIDMRYYYSMKTLLEGMRKSNRVNFVNGM